MKWKWFLGASILAAGLLIKFGAPLIPVALGIAAVALLNWWRMRMRVHQSK